MQDILREEYLDVYKGIQSEILSTTRFAENSDLSTPYLAKADRLKNNKIKAEESFPVSEQGYIMGNYWIVQNVKYCRIQEPVNPSRQSHIICAARHFILYQSLHPKHREFK